MRKLSLLVTSAAAVATLVLAGCGKAAENTNSATGSTGTAPTATGKAAFDSLKSLSDAVVAGSSKAKGVKVTMTASAAGMDMNGSGVFSFGGADTAMQMDMTTPEGAMSMVMLDGVFYMKMPEELEPGKPWMKLDTAGDNPLAKMLKPAMDQMRKADPRQTLQQLTDVGTIKSVAKDTVDGAQVDKYVIEVETLKELEKSGVSTAELGVAADQLPKSLTYTVWVNGDDLPVRFSTEIPAAGQVAKVQADYTDWGQPVTVTAPPADQVAEMPSF